MYVMPAPSVTLLRLHAGPGPESSIPVVLMIWDGCLGLAARRRHEAAVQ